jgi:hypothetical protein
MTRFEDRGQGPNVESFAHRSQSYSLTGLVGALSAMGWSGWSGCVNVESFARRAAFYSLSAARQDISKLLNDIEIATGAGGS